MCVCATADTHTDVLLSPCSMILGLFQRSSTRREGQLCIVFTLLLHIMAAKMLITSSSFRFLGGIIQKVGRKQGCSKVNSFLSFVIFFMKQVGKLSRCCLFKLRPSRAYF